MSGLSKIILPALLLSSTASSQTAAFYSYSKWDRLSSGERVAYISGVIDTMITILLTRVELNGLITITIA
jgi:hypothetical protein